MPCQPNTKKQNTTQLNESQSVMPPIHRASTVFFDNVKALSQCDWRNYDAYTYGREGSPTTQELERWLATIEGGLHTILAPSGLAAFSLASLALVQCGDRIALPANGYGTGTQMVDVLLRRFGVQKSIYEPTQPSSWNQTIPTGTRLIWIEAPGSITMEVPDLIQLRNHARSIGAYTIIDNTYSAGIHLKPFDIGIDVSMQALTKFQSGGADVLMGSLTCIDDELHARLLEARHLLGLNVSPDDAYLVIRGLHTMKLRYEQSSRSAELIANWFLSRPGVHRVLYPPFDVSPGFEYWKTHFTAAAGLFSVALSEDVPESQLHAFIEALQRFHIGFSWGGPSSLVMIYGHDHSSVQRLRNLKQPVGNIVRFWIGLEEHEILLEDIKQAWHQAIRN
ncbi:PLP-dependent transferase [Photorhabdus asymbiotica]|uniref:PLP-dependent transferase n=1 Tax=Photorhabdus asymbiotica TaxID=291112 RepID=UPI003DA77AF8